jgi:putative flippase GtrA
MLKKILFKYSNNSFVKYFFVGGVSALVDFLIFCLLYNFFRNWFLAGILSFFIATIANYYLSINLAFNSGNKFKKLHEIYLVFFVSFIGFVFNLIILFFFIEAFILNVYLSKIIATSLVFMWNFSARKFYIFDKKANVKS